MPRSGCRIATNSRAVASSLREERLDRRGVEPRFLLAVAVAARELARSAQRAHGETDDAAARLDRKLGGLAVAVRERAVRAAAIHERHLDALRIVRGELEPDVAVLGGPALRDAAHEQRTEGREALHPQQRFLALRPQARLVRFTAEQRVIVAQRGLDLVVAR